MSGPGHPSHRSENDPQPEVCALCGTIVAGNRVAKSAVEGLRGFYVCDVTPGCRRFRDALSWRDRRRLRPEPSTSIGDSRVWPAGGYPTVWD